MWQHLLETNSLVSAFPQISWWKQTSANQFSSAEFSSDYKAGTEAVIIFNRCSNSPISTYLLFHIHSKQCNMPTISLGIIWWTAGILARAIWCVCVCVCVCVQACARACTSVCACCGQGWTLGGMELWVGSNLIIFFFVYCCFSLQHMYIIFLVYTHC